MMMNTQTNNRADRLGERGFTVVEVLLATFLTSIIGIAALNFYSAEHNTLIVQQNVSDMQQNLRASVDEVVRNLRNAGANLPDGIQPVEMSDSNPDTLTIRYAPFGGAIDVGEGTLAQQDIPIHVSIGSDLSKFQVGMRVQLWHAGISTPEWFNITQITTNIASGWVEIYHTGQVLLFNPQAGDKILLLEELKYFINTADTANPLFMRQRNGVAADVYADNINDFQLQFMRTTLDTVTTLSAIDTALVGFVTMSAHTAQIDYNMKALGNDGRRYRTLSSEVSIRNHLQ
jgi:hypothetical protein